MSAMLALIQGNGVKLGNAKRPYIMTDAADFIKNHPSSWMVNHLRQVFRDLSQDDFEIRIQEFLKFIYVQSTQSGGFIPVAEPIDKIWHEYLLQTREYMALCQSLPGKKFIHHQTITLSEYAHTHDRTDIVKGMLDWLPNYYKHFGEFTERTSPYWVMVNFLSKELHLPLKEINLLASTRAITS